MIGVLYFLEAYIVTMVFKYICYGLIFVGICKIILKVYQYAKVSYLLNHIAQVKEIKLIKPTRQYKTIYEETGYSCNHRYYTTHYKAKQVPMPLVYKGTAFFKNGKIFKFQIVENSKFYNQLLKR